MTSPDDDLSSLRERSHFRSDPIPLGPFDLHEFLGKGAMGHVWRGRHRAQDVPAAIKVITEERSLGRRYQRQFRHEVRAAATLNHPGVVMVFDFGEIPESVEDATAGEILAGSPYLAMEMCPRGSLADRVGQLSWPDIRSILLSLLDALSHAHARGVIHRDLKPGNILLGEEAADWTGVKLSDFGLAFIPDRIEGDDVQQRGACGTPNYMSPEQLQGKWRDIGPWSDLYALGCLAYQLVSGRAPFEGKSIVETAKNHLSRPVPPVVPRVAVPDEFDAWLLRMLHKKPHQRFRCAADAAWALMIMPDPPSGEPDGAAEAKWQTSAQPSSMILKPFEDLIGSPSSNPAAPSTRPDDPNATVEGVEPPLADRIVTAGREPLAVRRPPAPSDWRHFVVQPPSLKLLGAGLGLYGLRRISPVGREAERDRLWDNFLEVAASQSPRAVLLRGAAGTGKSFLAEWLTERAAETGAALALRATHSRGPGGGEGLSRMLARHFRTVEMQRSEILSRVRTWLRKVHGVDDEYEWQALTEIISPATADDLERGAHKISFARPEQRYAAIARNLARIAKERPLIVWLDDLQWSSDSIAFARYLLSSPYAADLPALVVGTVREEALADEPIAESELDKLLALEAAGDIRVEALPDHEQSELIERLLYLEPAIARQVAAQTNGNPLYAVQLVGDWVERGVLEVGEHGFELAHGEEARLPDDLFEVWSSRLDGVLDEHSPDAARALELAATLGLDVREGEWRACCQRAELSYPDQAVQALLSNRLLIETDAGVRFVHGMLRDALVRRARQAGRWAEYNGVCADMLDPNDDRDGTILARLGRHLVEAGRYRESLDRLYQAIIRRGGRREISATMQLVDLRRQAIEALELSDDSTARIQNMGFRALALGLENKFEAGLAIGQRALAAANRAKKPELVAESHIRLAQVYDASGQWNRALQQMESITDAEHAALDQHMLDTARKMHSQLLYRVGEFDRASIMLRDTIAHARKSQNLSLLAESLRLLGICERRRGRLELAAELVHEALRIHEQLGDSISANYELNALGDIYRLDGQLDKASQYYQQTYEGAVNALPRAAQAARMNLAVVQIQQGRFADAYPVLEELRESQTNAESMLYLYALALLMPCLAARADWTRLARDFKTVREEIENRRMVDADFAIPAQIAGELAAESGLHRLAHQLLSLAAEQWQGAGHEEKTEEARQSLRELAEH